MHVCKFPEILKPPTDDQVFLDKFYNCLRVRHRLTSFSLTTSLVQKLVMPAFEQGSLSRKNLSTYVVHISNYKTCQGKTCQEKLGCLFGALKRIQQQGNWRYNKFRVLRINLDVPNFVGSQSTSDISAVFTLEPKSRKVSLKREKDFTFECFASGK